MPESINSAVIARAQSGDVDAIGAIYERYQDGVYRFLYYRVSDRQTAEELTGDVFIKMIKALPNYQIRKVPFQAWLFRIARNLTIDHYRKSSVRDHTVLTEGFVSDEEDLETQADRSLTNEFLIAALDMLTEDQREVIILRFLNQMPISEVAIMLDKSDSAVKALQRRGLQSLRKIMNEQKVTYVLSG